MSTLSKLISDGYTLPSNSNTNTAKSTKSTLSKVLAGDYDSPETYNNGGFLGGVGYVGARLGLGAFGILEGIWDFSAGGIAKLFGADEWAEEQFANNITGNAQADLDRWYNPSKGWQVAGDVSSGIGNSLVGMLAVAGVGAAVAASGGTLAPAVAAAISGGVIGLGSAGQSVTEAYQKTGELGGKEFAYGALSGITEAGLEYVSGAAGKVGAKLFAKQTAKTVAKKSIVKGLISDFAGEAFEEGVSEILDPYFQRWTQVDPNAENATAQEVGYAALIGGLSGVLMGGFGEAATTVKQIRLGNNIAKNSSSVSETLNYAKSFANYEAEHNTGRTVYTEISDLVSRYEAADRGDGTITVGQKKMLGQMGIDVAALVHDEGIQHSKANIIANADSFVKALNERGYTDAEGNPVHFASTQEFLANDAVVTRFATMDYLGQLLMSKDSVYDLVSSKGRTDGIMQADFRKFQKEATTQEKASVNELFGIDVDSITYEDFIDKIQYTSRDVFESRQSSIQMRKQAKNAVSQAINTKSDVATLDGKTVFAEGMSVFKTKGGDYVAISKQGNQYYLYADNNISKPLTKAELKAVIKAINGEQTTTRAKKPTTQATQTQQRTQATPTAQTVATETTDGIVQQTAETAVNSTTEENTSKPTATTESAVKAENNGTETATKKPKKKAKATETRTETAATTESTTQSRDTSAIVEKNPNQTKKKKTAKKKTTVETASKPTTESTTETATATETQKTISDKTYHDFTVKEFESLPQSIRQHFIAKNKAPNAIVFAQMGDFYEAFFSDAEKAADAVGLTLTSREVKGYSDKAKMVGIPVRYFDDYSAKLKAKGFDVVKVDSDGRKVIYRAENTSTTVDTAKNTTEKKPIVEKKKKTTTEKTTKTTKTEDFGEKIGGARKDTWQKRGLITSDLTAMNRRELQRHVKKENVWKRPDFVKAVAEGGDRAILYAQNELYKSLNATPFVRRSVATDTTSTAFQSVMEQYVSEVRDVQKLAESVKTKEDLGKITGWLIEKGYMEETGNTYGRRYAWTEKYYDSPALYRSDIVETTGKLAKGFDTLNETAIIEGFGTTKADKLPKGYSIRKYNSFWDNKGTQYVIVKGGKNGKYVSPYFSSYEDALAYGKKTFGTAETATVTADGKKKRYVPEQLKDVHRTGLDYRNGNNAVGENFIHDFGIKGGEFGNWLSETDRTTSLNYGYDAFCDLADALGIEMTDISLNGTLSIGFGSRGQGLSGAAAHYESERKVINLTKMNGAGSLAHEFWHAVEDYVSGDTHQGDMASDFSKMPEKTKAAGKALLDAINYKDRTVSIEEINENQAKALERNLRHLEKYLDTEFKIFSESMTEEQRAESAKTYRYKRTPTDADIKRFQALKEKAMQGENGVYDKFFSGEQTIVDDLNALLKDVKGRGMDKETRRSLSFYIEYAATYSKEAVETQTKRVKTQFHEDALAISKAYAKDGGYWDSNCEMLARAFAAYINAKTDGRNDYLSGHALGAVPVVGKDGAVEIAYTYPHDTAEAETIFKAFDDFFAAAKEDGLFHEATREKPKYTTQYAMSEDTQLNTTPNGSKGQQLKPLQMKHAETVARNNIKGYEALTEAEKLEVEWTLASAWRAGKSTTEALQLAKLSTAIGAGVGFADISTKTTNGKTVAPDAACYTRGGHLTIYLNPNGKRTVECATLHELVHSMEGMEGYSDLTAMAEEYYAKHPEEKAAIDNLYKDVYKNEQVKYAEEILPSELTAHYVESMLAKRDILAKITRENPTFVQKCIEKIKAIRNKLIKADSSADLSEVKMLETRFTSIFNINKGKIANKSGVSTSVATATAKQFSIQTDESGRQYVQADRRVILGDNPDVWKTQITKYINEVIRQGKDIKITTVEGDTLTITQNTAGKAAYQNENISKTVYKTKLNAEAHIDELSEISVSKKNADGTKKITPDYNNKHAGRNLAQDGWSYRTAYFRDFDGKTYKLTLSVAVDGTVESVYNVGVIKKTSTNGESRLMPQRTADVSSNSISENSGNVNPESTNTTKKFALPAKNSQGEALSEQQRAYFAESKVVDEQGRLLKVYHGTNNVEENSTWNKSTKSFDTKREKFTVFKRQYDEQIGHFFNSDVDNAGGYGSTVYECYLNIKNPLIIECNNRDYSIIAYDGMIKDTYEWADYAYKKGYDGVIFKNIRDGVDYGAMAKSTDEYVVFNSNQIKNVDNLTPTKSADIRYALTPENIKGSDRTLTELPDDRVTFRDVVTHKKKASDLTTQIKTDSKEFTEGWQIATTNAQAGLERVLRETGNSEATATTNYVRAAKNAAYGALTVGQFTLDGETYVGESWQKIWQPIYTMDKKDGQAYKMFNLYLLHWHNTDRYAVGKPVFGTDVTVSDSLQAIEQIEAEYPKFRKIAEKVWRFNDNNLQLGVDSGTLSTEYAATVREMYPHYVPTLRAEHSKPLATIQGKNNVRINPNNRRAIGSDLDILPIDETVAAQTIQRISSARTNKMLLDIKNGTAHDEFVIIGAESATADIDSDNLVTTYADKAKNTHQVTFWENGKSVTAEVSQNVYRGIESFMPSGDTTFNNILMNGVAKINTTFKKLVTAWNPFFVFFKNPIRDIQTALNYTRYSWSTFAKNYKRAVSEISSNGRYWQEAQAAGILSASVYDYRKGLQYKNKGKWANVMGKIESVSNAIEMAPRLSEYISARESGLSVQEALLQAQDVTTNFGRGGTLTKKANATFMPFLNPAVQGFSKLVRAYTGKDAAKSWGNLIIRSLILGVGLSALNDLLNEDDEDYQNLSDYIKNNNYVLALGDGQFLKIPKGRENGFIGELYLRARRYASGETDAWEGTFESFVSNLTPTDNFTRTIFSPFVDISTNSTWYGGTIESQKWSNTEPKNRYDESTSSISIWLGQVFNYSPIKIDYLLEQYLGVIADVALPATNLEAETGVISQNLLANSTNNSRWSTQFYSQLEKYNYKKTDGDTQAKGVVKYLNNISGSVSDLYNQKRAIQADKSLSNDEKLAQVKIIQTAINALQKESLTNAKILYEELGKYDLTTDDNFDTAYLYSVATVLGEEYALKSYNKEVYAKAQSLNTLGIEYGTYFDYYFGLKQITSDKNASGATISGSKKANVIAYTMTQDIPTVQKLILIMSAGYKISDGDISRLTAKQAKTLVVKYITKLDITREKKAELAQMCGFTVKNGRIYITD